MINQNVQVLSQYIKDLSMEIPHAQKMLSGASENTIEADIKVVVNSDKDNYNVDLSVKLAAKNNKTTAFILEIVYSCMMKIGGVDNMLLQPFLYVEIPSNMFPFVRNIIMVVTGNSGFPPVTLDNIDFMSLYMQNIQKQ